MKRRITISEDAYWMVKEYQARFRTDDLATILTKLAQNQTGNQTTQATQTNLAEKQNANLAQETKKTTLPIHTQEQTGTSTIETKMPIVSHEQIGNQTKDSSIEEMDAKMKEILKKSDDKFKAELEEKKRVDFIKKLKEKPEKTSKV